MPSLFPLATLREGRHWCLSPVARAYTRGGEARLLRRARRGAEPRATPRGGARTFPRAHPIHPKRWIDWAESELWDSSESTWQTKPRLGTMGGWARAVLDR
jgi:hypothetical protein